MLVDCTPSLAARAPDRNTMTAPTPALPLIDAEPDPGHRVRDPGATRPGPVRIIGIDPGSRCTGVGIIDVDAAGQARHVFHAGLAVAAAGDFASRLKCIFDGLAEIVAEYAPQEAAIERVFVARNPDSALKLGQARGAAICAVVARGIVLSEYAAREVKQAVVGTGSGDKAQVQHMVRLLLNLPDAKLQADAADALAVALTHAHMSATAQRTGASVALLRRR